MILRRPGIHDQSVWWSHKKHKEIDKPIQSNYMPENKTDRQCSVWSFKLYLSHLHPDNEYLWQQPNLHPKNCNSEVWYTRGHIRKNPLSTFVSDLCSRLITVCKFPMQKSLLWLENSLTKKLWKILGISLPRASKDTDEWSAAASLRRANF